MSSSNQASARNYLRALEEGASEDVLRSFFASDVIQEEFPNRLVPTGARRDLNGLLEAGRRGKDIVITQRFEILKIVESGDELALEVQWSGTFRIPIGSLAPGDTMRARFAVFITMRDGLIVSQRNYDCFDPF